MDNLGYRLRELREEKGISMDKMCEDLANLYDVSLAKSTISKWENDKAEPTLAYARILSKYFNVTLDYIIGTSDNKSEKEQSEKISTIAARLEGKNITPQKMKLLEKYIDALFEEDD